MRIGLRQLRTTRPCLGSSQVQFVLFFFAALALALFLAVVVALASRWSEMKTALTPDGSLAVPPNPMRARLRVLTFVLTPPLVTVFVAVVVSPNVRLARGVVMMTTGGVPSPIFTPTTAGGLTPP